MKLLDLFCGAGGAGEGYRRAGFEVTGVDNRPMPRNPHTFIQTDALEYLAEHGHEFDVIHASPPCQAHCSLQYMYNAKKHDSLVDATREGLKAAGRPYIIENVPGAPLVDPVVLCGTMFGLGSGDAELWRHRLFELSWGRVLVPQCRHRMKARVIGVYGGHGRDRRRTTNTRDYTVAQRKEAMGIDWMTGAELSQAIPPIYTEYLGRTLANVLLVEGVS